MKVSLIVASDRNRIIGSANTIPWRLSGDMKHFKQTTMGQVLIMGRKTFDSIGRPLPGRKTVVVTRSSSWNHLGALRANSIEEAMEMARSLAVAQCFIAGGGEVYRLGLPYAEDLYWTQVDAEVEGDTSFPELGPGWQCQSSDPLVADEKNEFDYRIEYWKRG